MTDDYGIRATKHAWLGIDPGVTTGWALVDDSGALQASGNLPEDHLRTGLDDLVRHLHREGLLRLDAVIENMPRVGGMGRLAKRLEDVRRIITEVIEDVYEIPTQRVAPGEWKPSRVARETRFGRGKMTPHERDAARMAMYVRSREWEHEV